MTLFALLSEFAPAEFHVVRRRDLGLTAFIALDDLRLGPACGGIRWRQYACPEEGVHDVLRLARAMTYKNAVAGLDFGGGKTVVLRDPRMEPERAFPALGEAIEGLGGRYVTACDYGTTARELALVKTRTSHALAEDSPGALDRGTATGVLSASRAIWRRLTGAATLAGARVSVQGVGDVGLPLVELLQAEGAEVAFSEIDEAKAEQCVSMTGASRIPRDDICAVSMDVFCPCAVGETITEDVALVLAARGVAGAANNQLATDRAGTILHDRGILYVPDFVANAGAVIVGFETGAGRAASALDTVRKIEDRAEYVLAHADSAGITPAAAAIELARARLDAVGTPDL